jgi:outer membrane protein OmpA-like peptidoglycan-associated protein
MVTGFRPIARRREVMRWRQGYGSLCGGMAWFAFALSLLLQAAAPSTPAPAPAPAPRAAVPVRPRPWPETGPSIVYFALGSARVDGEGIAVVSRMADDYRRNGRVAVEILANADNKGSQASNRRLTQRRARAVADALIGNGIPRTAIVLRPVGESEPQVMTPDGVAEPLNRYARMIFPVPPPPN